MFVKSNVHYRTPTHRPPSPAIARAHLGWGPLLGLHEVGTAAWMGKLRVMQLLWYENWKIQFYPNDTLGIDTC